MFRYVLSRLLQIIPVLFVIVTLTFFMIRFVPGGPFTSERALNPQILRSLEAFYGLDRPLYAQYFSYLGNLVAGDLGPSFRSPGMSVNEIIAAHLPVSLELGGWALLVSLVIGVPAGIAAALKRNTWIDYATSSIALGGICVPAFVLGPVLVLIFAIHLRLVGASGWYLPEDRILPALTLGMAYAAYIARLTRGGLSEVLSQDFIRTARAKGASELRVVLRHALRGGLLPVVTFLGPAAAGILTGSFVVETVFQIPGLGRAFVNSAFNRDYTLILGTVVVYAGMVALFNLLADLAAAALNPRMRLT